MVHTPGAGIVCIGGLDTTGGAGLAADIRVAAALRVPCQLVATALASQSASGVFRNHPVADEALADQLRCVDWGWAGAAKLGMVHRRSALDVIATAIPEDLPLVIDPVVTASCGGDLAEPGLLEAVVSELASRAALLTLNRDETAHLGFDYPDLESARHLAPEISQRLSTSILLKGGHLAGEPVDVLAGPEGLVNLPAGARSVQPCRGTGCALAAAIACGLALGLGLPRAAVSAKELINRGVAMAYPGAAGPVLGFTPIRDCSE